MRRELKHVVGALARFKVYCAWLTRRNEALWRRSYRSATPVLLSLVGISANTSVIFS